MVENNKEELIEIYNNITLLDFYLDDSINILDENVKSKMFDIFAHSMLEEPYCFFRIVLFIANNRKTSRQEIFYKHLVHYLTIISPESVLANMDLFLSCGYKKDLLLFLQAQSIAPRVLSYYNSKSKNDNDLQKLKEGKIPKEKHNVIKYDYNTTTELLELILDDPYYNGITLSN